MCDTSTSEGERSLSKTSNGIIFLKANNLAYPGGDTVFHLTTVTRGHIKLII